MFVLGTAKRQISAPNFILNLVGRDRTFQNQARLNTSYRPPAAAGPSADSSAAGLFVIRLSSSRLL